MDLHKLVELPHGEATKRIKAAGKWDESKVESDGEEREWIVTVHVDYKEYETRRIQVWALSYEEACEKAEDEAHDDYDVITAEAVKAERV